MTGTRALPGRRPGPGAMAGAACPARPPTAGRRRRRDRARAGVRPRRDEPLSRHTTMRVGGPADLLAVAHDAAQLAALVRFARGAGLPHVRHRSRQQSRGQRRRHPRPGHPLAGGGLPRGGQPPDRRGGRAAGSRRDARPARRPERAGVRPGHTRHGRRRRLGQRRRPRLRHRRRARIGPRPARRRHAKRTSRPRRSAWPIATAGSSMRRGGGAAPAPSWSSRPRSGSRRPIRRRSRPASTRSAAGAGSISRSTCRAPAASSATRRATRPAASSTRPGSRARASAAPRSASGTPTSSSTIGGPPPPTCAAWRRWPGRKSRAGSESSWYTRFSSWGIGPTGVRRRDERRHDRPEDAHDRAPQGGQGSRGAARRTFGRARRLGRLGLGDRRRPGGFRIRRRAVLHRPVGPVVAGSGHGRLGAARAPAPSTTPPRSAPGAHGGPARLSTASPRAPSPRSSFPRSTVRSARTAPSRRCSRPTTSPTPARAWPPLRSGWTRPCSSASSAAWACRSWNGWRSRRRAGPSARQAGPRRDRRLLRALQRAAADGQAGPHGVVGGDVDRPYAGRARARPRRGLPVRQPGDRRALPRPPARARGRRRRQRPGRPGSLRAGRGLPGPGVLRLRGQVQRRRLAR